MNAKTALNLLFYDISNAFSFGTCFCFISSFKNKQNQLKFLKSQAVAIFSKT